MTDLAAQAARLSPAKRALLEKLLKQPPSGAARSIGRRAADGPAPLSFAQQRLWFFDQLEPQNPFYNVSASVPIEGPLDADRLENCLRAVIARHESLRTVFLSEQGQPRQMVLPSIEWRLARYDLSRLPPTQRAAEENRLTLREAEKPFDLAKGPLLRASLIDLGDGHWRLLLTMHHIICDGWSMGVLRRELATLYASPDFPSSGGQAALPLEPLPLQYADYAVWQQERMQGNFLARQLDYWKSKLGDGSPALELPTDRPRPLVQRFRGDMVAATIPLPVTESLRVICREERATLFMGLLAALQTLLMRYSGQTDISVGSPIANRPRPELEPLIGFFANTLVFRADLSGEPTFRELLRQVRDTAMGAFAHQETPFERLVDELAPQRDLGRSPLFQVMFVLQNTPAAASSAAGLRVGQPQIGLARTANFDLTLNAEETPRGLNLQLVYNVDLFDRETAERMLSAYQSLLRGLSSAGPEQKITRLPLLEAAQQRRLLWEWNSTEREYPADACLHDLFTRQAQTSGQEAAVIEAAGQLTYAELDRRSNQLARYLKSRQVGPETPVGICLDRSSAMVISLLAVLKAGGAYVPLDPRYPPERLAFMLEDARPPLVISRKAIAENLLAGASARAESLVLDLDELSPEIACQDDRPLANTANPDNLAYIIYTSGSTGNPKGVLMPHRGAVNFVSEYVRRVGMGPGDRMLQVVSLSFDASVEEIFTTLSSGAALVIHPAPAELAPRDLLDLLRREKVNLLHFPPSLWQGLVDELAARRARGGEDAAAYGFKAFLTGGEPVSPESLKLWNELTGRRVKFIAAYGVTEAAVTTTLFEYDPAAEADGDQIVRPNIGRPIGNTRIYVLDSHLQPAPLGAPGELCIGGLGVARGYWNLPALTAEKFLPDPYSPIPGSRLYRTGDLGRMRADGSLEFLGRIDAQVKIRGFRIELGEIEAALLKRPDVREAVVIAREDKPGVKRLAAYLTSGAASAEGEQPASAAELRAWLKGLLPEHMIPASFTWLEAMPLTASQKVDRRRLPAPDLSRPEGDVSLAAPRTPAEEQLAQIWSSVLGVANVGIHDNFFELGGDSILTIQVISRAAEAGLHFTPKQMFLHQTIAELAPMAGSGPAILAEQGPVVGEAPLTPVQHEFFALNLVDAHHFNQAVMLQVRGGMRPEVAETALGLLVEQHDALRTFVAGRPADRHPEQAPQLAIAAPGAFRLHRHDLSHAADPIEAQRMIETIAAQAQSSFDLTAPGLFRADWFDLGSESARLLLSAHHLAVDGVSWRVLLEDLAAICKRTQNGETPVLPPKTTSARQWASRLRDFTQSGGFEEQIAYWESPRGGANLPRDRQQGENLEQFASAVVVRLSAEETSQLLTQAQSAYRTQVSDLLLTALAQTLARWIDDVGPPSPEARREVAVDLEGYGREPLFDDIDLSRTVGWFTALYPVGLPLPAVEGSQPGDDIKEVKAALRTVPTGGLGYGALRWLRDDRELARRPLSEISFNYLGQFDQVLPPASPFGLAAESTGPLHSPRQRRSHLLEVISHVVAGELSISWGYSERIHDRRTVEWLAETHLDALRRLIEHCLSSEAGGFIPADFPLANVDADDLDALSRLLSQE